jgi:hypothetical protein
LAVTLVVVLAVLGGLAVAAGVGLVFLPAGLIVAGLELLAAAYVIRYLGVRREVP